MGLQLLLVVVQNRKKGVQRILKEMAIVVTALKAPVNAFRVSSGKEKEPNSEFDPHMEMTMSKGIEMFAESIPSIAIQTSAILSAMNSGGAVPFSVYLSLFISVFTTGFVSATLSYDIDTDPKKRGYNSEFYGYVPDSPSKRAVLFMTMILMSAVQVLIKGVLVVILGSMGLVYALSYMVGDLLFYLVYKLVRRDFKYWFKIEGMAGLAVSLLLRAAVKFVTDFTGCMHTRHPYEVRDTTSEKSVAPHTNLFSLHSSS